MGEFCADCLATSVVNVDIRVPVCQTKKKSNKSHARSRQSALISGPRVNTKLQGPTCGCNSHGSSDNHGFHLVFAQPTQTTHIVPEFLRRPGYQKAVWPQFFLAAKWPQNWIAGLIFGAADTARRAPSIQRGSGTKFSRKSKENQTIRVPDLSAHFCLF